MPKRSVNTASNLVSEGLGQSSLMSRWLRDREEWRGWDEKSNANTTVISYLFAEQHEHSEQSEANNCGLFEIPRYLYIYIYMCVCLHVHCTRPCTPYASPITLAHCILSFGTLAAVQSTTLRSLPLNRYGRRRQFSWRQPGHDSNLSRMHTATAHKKRPDDDNEWLGPYAYSYQTQ